MNRKADFLLNESIRIDSHNESNRIDSNRELECSTARSALHYAVCLSADYSCPVTVHKNIVEVQLVFSLLF